MLGIGHVALVTRDFARLRAFYCEVFGAHPAYGGADDTERGGPGFLEIGNLILHVFERDEEALGAISDADAARAFRRGRVDHIALLAEDEAEFEAIRERLLLRGATTGEVVDFGPLASLFAADPDGTMLEVSIAHDDARRRRVAGSPEGSSRRCRS